MPRRTALAVLVLIALGLAAFQAANPGYSITFPAGWTSRPADPATGISSAFGPDGTINCNAQSNPMPTLDAYTQDQLNAAFSTPMNPAEWANLVGIDPALISVRDAEARPIGGVYLQIATLELKAGATGNPEPVTARMGTIPLPGRLVNSGCYVRADQYPGFAALFETTISSLRPR